MNGIEFFGKKYIGLSVSFCVMDIADGKVPFDEVACILAGTRIKKPNEDLSKVIKEYSETYWKEDPHKYVRVFVELWQKDLIIQPRLDDITVSIHGGHWLIYTQTHDPEKL